MVTRGRGRGRGHYTVRRDRKPSQGGLVHARFGPAPEDVARELGDYDASQTTAWGNDASRHYPGGLLSSSRAVRGCSDHLTQGLRHDTDLMTRAPRAMCRESEKRRKGGTRACPLSSRAVLRSDHSPQLGPRMDPRNRSLRNIRSLNPNLRIRSNVCSIDFEPQGARSCRLVCICPYLTVYPDYRPTR